VVQLLLVLFDTHGTFALPQTCKALLRVIGTAPHAKLKILIAFCMEASDGHGVDSSGFVACLRLRVRKKTLWSCSSIECTNVMDLWSAKFKECAECHVPRYCSENCQRVHWCQEHSVVCKKGHQWNHGISVVFIKNE